MFEDFKAGTYYIGDPCYVIPDEDWMPLLEATNYLDGEDQTYKGQKIFCHGTAHGDGVYTDQLGRTYPVDAGLIGIVPIELVENLNEAIRLGQIVRFDHDFIAWAEDGVFEFDNIKINTRDFDEEEDEEYYDDEDDDVMGA